MVLNMANCLILFMQSNASTKRLVTAISTAIA